MHLAICLNDVVSYENGIDTKSCTSTRILYILLVQIKNSCTITVISIFKHPSGHGRKYMNATRKKYVNESEMANSQSLDRFPIRVLSEQTGVGASTLRAWERRYGLLKPERTPKGHRLYCAQDVALIERILTLLEEGHALPHIAKLIKDEVEVDDDQVSSKGNEQTDHWAALIEKTLAAVRDYSSERIESIYNDASSLYPVDLVTARLVEPVLKILGSTWQERDSGIAEEHFYTNWLNHRLGARFHHAVGQATGNRLICACLPGSFHETGLKLFSISALARGYRVLYFGSNLPLEQIPLIVERSSARGVVLSTNQSLSDSTHEELAELLDELDVPVFLGGRTDDKDKERIEKAGGILLGENISVALKVIDTHLPAYARGRQN